MQSHSWSDPGDFKETLVHVLTARETSFVEAQKAINGELTELNPTHMREGMILRNYHGQRSGAKRLSEELSLHFCRGSAGECQLNVAAAQGRDLFTRMHLQNLDADIGFGLVEVLQSFGEQAGKGGRNESDSQRNFSARLAERLHRITELLSPPKDVAGLGESHLTRGGKTESLGLSNKKRYIPLVFEISDLSRDRGLRNVQARGGSADVGLFGSHDEITQVSQFHFRYN